MRKNLSLLLLAAFLACLGTVANASQENDLSGTWTGFAERQGSQDSLTLVLTKKDNSYTGRLSDAMGMFQDVEITNFLQKGETITFDFGGGMGGEVFNLKAELKLSGDTMSGTWTMVGADDSGGFEVVRKK